MNQASISRTLFREFIWALVSLVSEFYLSPKWWFLLKLYLKCFSKSNSSLKRVCCCVFASRDNLESSFIMLIHIPRSVEVI